MIYTVSSTGSQSSAQGGSLTMNVNVSTATFGYNSNQNYEYNRLLRDYNAVQRENIAFRSLINSFGAHRGIKYVKYIDYKDVPKEYYDGKKIFGNVW